MGRFASRADVSREGRQVSADQRGQRTRRPRCTSSSRRSPALAGMGAMHPGASDRRPHDTRKEHTSLYEEAGTTWEGGRMPRFTPREGQEKALGAGDRLTASRWAGDSGWTRDGGGPGRNTGHPPHLKGPCESSQGSSLPSWRRDGRNALVVHRGHVLPPHTAWERSQCPRAPSTLPSAQEHARDVLTAVLVCESHLRSRARWPQKGHRGAPGAPTVYQA